MQKYAVIEKKVGETPLAAMEAWRKTQGITPDTPLTYAGRLDPMASGKLLVLIGDECKEKERYLELDKAYTFEVLLGLGSDTHDVLGRLSLEAPTLFDERIIRESLSLLTGDITLPYPNFSSKTVQGKPLHTWTLEDKLDTIEIPTKQSRVYTLKLLKTYTKRRSDVYAEALEKINSLPPVTDARKALGNDFRRTDVRADWEQFNASGTPEDLFYVAQCYCIASSGTYMRSLANQLGKMLETPALAFSIHRGVIGRYLPVSVLGGVWTKRF